MLLAQDYISLLIDPGPRILTALGFFLSLFKDQNRMIKQALRYNEMEQKSSAGLKVKEIHYALKWLATVVNHSVFWVNGVCHEFTHM